jgi:6-pyruvoyltetrahydropterin/6-carboxytetrahydropterin synthase
MIATATIGKRFTLEASHVLPHHAGKCAQLHGHSYVVEVALEGPVKPATGEPDEGMVLDFARLSDAWALLHKRMDHRHLNDVLPGDYQPPTAEHLAHYVLAQLSASELPLAYVRVWETATSWAMVRTPGLVA